MTNQYALEATQHEVTEAYRNLDRMLNGGDKEHAMKAAIRLADQDPRRLWNYLREYSCLRISVEETTPLLIVNALSENWAQDQKDVFIARAVLELVQATKGNSSRHDEEIPLTF
jgi:hypothetical protein